MKIIGDNGIYVQKRDISNISTYDLPMPGSIFMMAIGEKYNSNDMSSNEFYLFTDKEDIDFFRKVEWILNYDEVINLEAEDIILLIRELSLKRRNMVNEFNFNSIESVQNVDLAKECNNIDLLIDSLNYVFWVKSGDIKFELPDDAKTNIKKDGFKVLERRLIRDN